MNSRCFTVVLGALLLLVSCGGGEDTTATTVARRSSKADQALVSRLIVKVESSRYLIQAEQLSDEMTQAMSQHAGVGLRRVRVGALGTHVLELAEALSTAQAQSVATRLHTLPGVTYAEIDARAKISVIPNDPNFSSQWALAEPERVAGGINAVGAWDITQGVADIVVAVVDTGVLPHRELSGRMLPGYDFVSDVAAANDGNGRDADGSDPGDWILASEASKYGETSAVASSWHGTHVAGIIGAAGNNGSEVAGIAWKTRILPVRVLGKGGGYSSDIADGIIWAVGGAVPGVPTNPYPAKVVNLSLGGEGACTSTYQSAIDFARSRGATVVVAAGNEASPASNSRPANCLGVVSVAATSIAGAMASYSNFGPGVTLAAPGGDSDSTILSLGDGGSESPKYDNSLRFSMGTSMAAPIVSGVVALMLAVNPSLTPDQVQSVLTYTVSRFPTGTAHNCTTVTCGAGIVNALSAVRAVAAGSVGNALPSPQSGWWWNETEGGRGYAIEIRNGSLFMAGFLYENTGRATWFVSSGIMTDNTHYQGSMSPYSGGQTLTGAFKPATAGTSLGTVKLAFSSATRGSLTWPNGQTTLIQRFDIVSGGTNLAQTGFAPEAGWWWNQTEPGRGFAIEVQGNSLFIAGFMYDEAGQPIWYVSTGNMVSPSYYTGHWTSYANGQAMGQPFKPPIVINANAGLLTINFSDTRNATITLPDGRLVPVQRFLDYGVSTPVTVDSPNLKSVNKMLGSWLFNYDIGSSSFTDNITFDTALESSTTAGTYYAWGLNQYAFTTLVGFDDANGNYYMLSEEPDSASFDDFYTFTLDASGRILSGCYYLYYRTDTLSSCYPLNGSKIANSGARSVLLTTPEAIEARSAKKLLMERKRLLTSAMISIGSRPLAAAHREQVRSLANTLRQ